MVVGVVGVAKGEIGGKIAGIGDKDKPIGTMSPTLPKTTTLRLLKLPAPTMNGKFKPFVMRIAATTPRAFSTPLWVALNPTV